VAWCNKIYPAKSLNGASSMIVNGPGSKSILFEGARYFLGPLNGTSVPYMRSVSVVPLCIWCRFVHKRYFRFSFFHLLGFSIFSTVQSCAFKAHDCIAVVPNLTFITVSRPGGSPEHREETQGRFVGASK